MIPDIPQHAQRRRRYAQWRFPPRNGRNSRHRRELRLTVIDVMAWSGGAHVGGSLSIIDILTILYFKYLDVNPADPQWDERDRFVLSKGHAAAGLIPVLAKRGFFPEETLKTFNHFGSPFAMHPDSNKVIGCDASAGSLGHGLSMAVGMALGARQRKMPWKTVCLMGDGECCEGSVWEAAMSAPHFKLGNLIGIVDRNRFMIDGRDRGRHAAGTVRGQVARLWLGRRRSGWPRF